MAHSKDKLKASVQVFVDNALRPGAQAVIASVGYGPTKLAEGAALLAAMRTSEGEAVEQLTAQKHATRAEAAARKAAQKAAASLSETARALFAGDDPTLTLLGLNTQYVTVTDPTTNVSKTVAARPPQGFAELQTAWGLLFTGAAKLDTAQAEALAGAGWPSTRVEAGQALVAAYAAANSAQQAAVQAYQAASQTHIQDTAALKRWYSTASALCKRAIQDQDPANSGQLRELLGFG